MDDERSDTSSEWSALQRLLNEWDPIGVCDADADYPNDEYDCLYEPLMNRLRNGESAHDLNAFLERQLRDHFGLDPRWSRPHEFAQRLVDWYTREQP